MKNFLFIILLICLGCKNSSDSELNTTGGASESPAVSQSETEEFMNILNAHRSILGLRKLIHTEDLDQIAQEHSANMAQGKVSFGHTGFSDRCVASRKALGGGNWCGENVAKGQISPQSVFDSWLNSSGHKANMEKSRATHTGFGMAKSSSGTRYWTQVYLEY